TTMEASTAEDWKIIASQFGPYAAKLPDRVLSHLALLEGDCGGYAVDRLAHSLQTATLAHRDGRDEEYVVCALLHDIGRQPRLLQPCRHRRRHPAALRERRERLDGREARHL